MVHTVDINGSTFRNCYTHLLEPPVYERLRLSQECPGERSQARGHLVDQIVATWWEQNMHTVFVSNAFLAKNIRHVCQEDIESLNQAICEYNP